MHDPTFLEELRSLACLAAMRSDLVVEASSEPDAQWQFNWRAARITVVASDMQLRPADFSRGLVLHEAAHAAVTRLQEIAPNNLLHDNTTQHLFNVIEDCRIETWLQQRLPGCAPWIRLYNNLLFDAFLDLTAEELAQNIPQAFLGGILHRWWYGDTPEHLPQLAATALEEVWQHCHAAIQCLPPIAVPDAHATLSQYQAHPVAQCKVDNVTQATSLSQCSISAMEMAILMAQHDMWTIVWQHILPVLQRLIESTGMDLPPMQSPAFMSGPHHTCAADAQATTTSIDERRYNMEGFMEPACDDAYFTTYARLAHLIEPLANRLLQYLIAENRTHYRRHQASGQRLDLRMAMQFQADPRVHDRIWMRKLMPCRPDPMFVILVDTSGSMQGEKAEATFDALVLMREVCLRTGIPLGIIAFDHRTRVLQNWNEPDSIPVARRLESVLDADGAYTHMHLGLQAAAQMLATCPYRHRYLWLLSDGQPSDGEATQQRLQAIRPQLTGLFALGLGPATNPLANLIPGALTNLTAEVLPTIVARIFQQSILTS